MSKRKEDSSIAEFNHGTIRSIRVRDWQNDKNNTRSSRRFCLDCGKDGYRSEESARQVIGSLVRNGQLEQGAFALTPYICHHGWWHFGRDYKVIAKINAFVGGKISRLPVGRRSM